MNKFFSKISPGNLLLFLLLFLVIGLLTSHLRNEDILFHTDVARDFLVLEEIVQTKKPTLIGARSGGIPGVFHGPSWYYVNLPFFLFSQGNPVMMGWFWWLIGITAVFSFTFVIFKLTKNITASLLGALCFSLILLPACAGPVNNYLADLFSFLVFLVWLRWYEKPTVLLSLIGWFGTGLLVQFQMAFAVPIILLLLPIFIWRTLKLKLYYQIPSILILAIPLSTFILFELRHDFLQIKSVIQYIQGSGTAGATFVQRVWERFQLMSLGATDIFSIPKFLAPVVVIAFVYIGVKSNNKQIKKSLQLLGYLYFAWWIISLVFSGSVWSYYFSPFWGIFLLVISLIAAQSHLAKILLFFLILSLFSSRKVEFFYSPSRFDASSWKLLSGIAKDGLAKENQGYFLYSQDQFAYPLKYAFSYFLKRHPNIQADAFKKKNWTVLVKAADDPNNPWLTAEYWQHEKVKITQEPALIKEYPFGYTLEVYNLEEKDLLVPSDPNLIQNLHFR
ncbi:MAG: hypothetical protein ACOX50_02685 [Patescibacteria group bacterium]|jgi:hypothetical protein